MDGFWVTLRNSAGVLDARFVRTEEEARDAALELLQAVPNLCDGDRLNVEAAWSEG